MDKLFFILSILLLTVSSFFSLYGQFQMLQQNSYFPSRYFKWVSGAFSPSPAVCCIFFCAIMNVFYSRSLYVLALCVAAAWLIFCVFGAIRKAGKSIKPLVFTGRIKRLYAAAIITVSALDAVFIVLYGNLASTVCMMISVMLCTVTPLLCLTAWLLTLPVEKAFNRYYINDAKKILKSSPRLTVIGITGSYGKTTTKFILTRILSERFNTLCTPASFNTPLGVVRTVREKLKPQTEIFVCEMGAKNKGDIKEICDIVHPSYGIITSVGPQHLETFKSEDTVFDTKFELCDSIEKYGKMCFAYAGSPGIAARRDKKPFCTYFGDGTDYFADNIVSSAKGTSFDMHLKGETVHLNTKLLGIHSVSDILSAAAVAFTLGVSADDIKVAVSSLKATEHRLELKPFMNGSLVIDDAYNSNPEGCLEALNVLGSFEGMRKTVITPGLVELGDREYDCNYKLGLACAAHADDIILVGINRSEPMKKAVLESDFDQNRLHIVPSFKAGLEIYGKYADKESVLLIENDLPDNYLN